MGWNAVEVRKYADGTQEMMDPARKAVEMVGSAVATMTESSVETMMHSERPMNTVMIVRNGRRFVWSVRTRCGAGGGACAVSLELLLSSCVVDMAGVVWAGESETAASFVREWVEFEFDIAGLLDTYPAHPAYVS